MLRLEKGKVTELKEMQISDAGLCLTLLNLASFINILLLLIII